jgi:hypothetical protein
MGARTNPVARCKTAFRAAVLAAAVLLLAWGCCGNPSIKIGRIADFLNGVISISIELSLSTFATMTFDGDFGAWAAIPEFSTDEITADLSAAAFFHSKMSFDVDYDAADEGIELLGADDAALSRPLFFASWRGDKYTADSGVCYLGWVDEDEVRLAASWCGEDEGVMYCSMHASGYGVLSCELCEAGSACVTCDMGGELNACLPTKISGSIDIDVDIDIDIDVDVDVGIGECGGS